MWSQLEPTPPHITYLTLSLFLIPYALFSLLIRNRLHLSVPPLAVATGILLGPSALHILSPHNRWGLTDVFTQELTRVVLSLQCFAVGIELPAHWFRRRRHAVSVLYLLGPVMTYSWAVVSLLAYVLFTGISLPGAMIIGACLSPTDPVLAASVLGASRFSSRVPARLRHLLAAESACNDGASFPFLYIGLAVLTTPSAAAAVREWFLITILYQCLLGLAIGYVLGVAANKLLRFSEGRRYCDRAEGLVVFYLLLAVLCVGVGSTLGSDDFLLAFGAGVGFAHDGWFGAKSDEVQGEASFKNIIDLLLDSGVFVYFGAMVPFSEFVPAESNHNHADVLRAAHVDLPRLFAFLFLVLALRRIPALLALHACGGRGGRGLVPDVRSWAEALFAGHFGPMGVGALFLAVEARAQLETGTSIPLPGGPKAPHGGPPYSDRDVAIAVVWPVVCFVVLGSTLVHGLSVLGISLGSHFSRPIGERAPLLGAEREGLAGMVHDGDEEDDDVQ